MTGANRVALDWRVRARSIVADLLVFDPARLGWRLAIRTILGMLPPLILGRFLGLPDLYLVALAAFLLACGDSTDDGDHLQMVRLTIAAGLTGVAMATGVTAGANLSAAILGTMVWGCLAGLMGVYGGAFATMGLPIIWAFAEVGLAIPDHSITNAVMLGVLYTAGGGFIAILTWLIRIAGPYGPLRRQTAICYRAVADYLAGTDLDRTDAIAPETRVRGEIALARRLAADLRRGPRGWSRAAESGIALIETADRLFSLAVVRRDAYSQDPLPPQCADAAHRIAGAMVGLTNVERLRDALTQLDEAAAVARGRIEQDIVAELSQALRVLLYDRASKQVAAEAEPTVAEWSAPLSPLLTCLDRKSIVGRHALRFATVTSIAVVCFWYFPKPFGYWIPLTVTVVMRPYAGVTLSRTVQRIIGTTGGILFSSALIPLLSTPNALLAVIATAFFCMMVTLPFNYSLAIFFLSTGLIPFEHFVNPDLTADVALMRLAATGIGATLAIMGGHLLWPAFERNTLPALLAASVRSIGSYAGRVMTRDRGPAALAAIEVARREAGLDTTNLQAAVHRSLSEIGGDAAQLHAAMLASAGLQRLMNALNTATIVTQDPAVTVARLTEIANEAAPYLQCLGADHEELMANWQSSPD